MKKIVAIILMLNSFSLLFGMEKVRKEISDSRDADLIQQIAEHKDPKILAALGAFTVSVLSNNYGETVKGIPFEYVDYLTTQPLQEFLAKRGCWLRYYRKQQSL